MANMVGLIEGFLILVMQVIFICAESIEISLYPSDNFIFIGEKTIVNTTVRFLRPVYEDVKVTLYPSMDGPDMYIRRILGVHIGENVHVSGKVIPRMEWGNENAVLGEYFACDYFLGTIKRVPKSREPLDDVITFQYEAIIGAEGTYEDGHDHIIGASVQAADDFAITQKHVTMKLRARPRSLPSSNTCYVCSYSDALFKLPQCMGDTSYRGYCDCGER